jgi:hypothetical protein
MEENIKSLILIASELEAFKLRVYTLLNKEKWLDDFIMNNAPCNYNLQTLIREIQEGKSVHKVKACEDGLFHGIDCIKCEDGSLGFRKSKADIRPSSCVWIDKENAEKLFNVFKSNGVWEDE